MPIQAVDPSQRSALADSDRIAASGGARGPWRVSMRGGDGVRWPAAGADFFGLFLRKRRFFLAFFARFFTCFHGNSAYLRPCYHALRQPVGAADRAMMHN